VSKFHTLKVSAVKRETHDSVSVAFEIPSGLEQNFRYLPGQYLTLKMQINGEQVNRSYSFCSSYYVGEPMTIAVKKVTNGKASTYINDVLKAGDTIEVMEPMGNFHSTIEVSNVKHYLLFGGGSGITPLLSILKSVMAKEPLSSVTLFYANRDEQSVIFKGTLDSLLEQYSNRLKVVHITDTPSGLTKYSGYLVKDLAIQLLREHTDFNFSNVECFICGPTPMMKEVESALASLNLPKEKVHIEYFTAKADEDKTAADVGTASSADAPFTGKAKVKLIYDGNEVEFEMNEKETVLSAALDAGYDPPYSCMVAACCTCRAKLMEGKVVMDDRESLTDAEINRGYVLTCQAHPKTATVVLNFDI